MNADESRLSSLFDDEPDEEVEPEEEVNDDDLDRDEPDADADADEDGDSEEGDDEPDEESEIDRIMREYRNDPVGMEKALAKLNRGADPLEEVRRELAGLTQKLDGAAQTQQQERKEDELLPNHVRDDLGVQYIPDEMWRSPEYVSSVIDYLINDGMTEEDARAAAPVAIQQAYNAHHAQYQQARNEVLARKEADIERVVAELRPKQVEEIKRVEKDMSEQLSGLFSPEETAGIVRMVKKEVAALAREASNDGTADYATLNSPDVVAPLYWTAFARLGMQGKLKKIIFGSTGAEATGKRPAPPVSPLVAGSVGDSDKAFQRDRPRRTTERRLTSDGDAVVEAMRRAGLPVGDEVVRDFEKGRR